jgi:hypothetical protein
MDGGDARKRELGMIAMTQFSPTRRLHSTIGLIQHSAHQRTRLSVLTRLVDRLTHHFDGLFHQFLWLEFRPSRHDVDFPVPLYHGANANIDVTGGIGGGDVCRRHGLVICHHLRARIDAYADAPVDVCAVITN